MNYYRQTCPSGSFPYVVVAGDTIYLLAQRYNTTVQAILAINPGIDPNNLQIGQVICIPGQQPSQCPPGTFSYMIKAGDTCYNLAQQFNTTVAAIQAANPGLNCNNLQIGQTICIPGQQPPTCPTGSTTYVIKAGDTCYSLAQRFNTTVAAIQAINPGLNCNNLQIGQPICIPGQQPPTTCPAGTTSYVIKAGDTCYALAIQFNTTVAAIQAANPGLNCNNLQIGQTICIPGQQPPTTCPTGTFSYTIKAGDTCYALAIQYNTTVAAIQAANPGLNCNNLQIGQKICIPGQQPPATCPAGTFSYVVMAGDTCYSLALQFNTTVAAIQAANPGLNCNNLMIGQTICIPGQQPPTCMPGSTLYVIKPGDTCYSLALQFNTTVAAILAINPGLNCNNLVIGQPICIPGQPSQCPAGSVPYVVKAGDTVYSIAQANNTTVFDILYLNPGLDPNNLQVGQTICIP